MIFSPNRIIRIKDIFLCNLEKGNQKIYHYGEYSSVRRRIRQSEMKEEIFDEVHKWCRLLRSLQLDAK